MTTIEEKIQQECLVTSSIPKYVLFDDVVRFATEQDRILRQEERERCIKASQEYLCSECQYKNDCKGDCHERFYYEPIRDEYRRCYDFEDIRKAIEEGCNNGND